MIDTPAEAKPVKIAVALTEEEWEQVCLALQERSLEKARNAESTRASNGGIRVSLQYIRNEFMNDSDRAARICNDVQAQAKLEDVFTCEKF